jgi:hypothetical protein
MSASDRCFNSRKMRSLKGNILNSVPSGAT